MAWYERGTDKCKFLCSSLQHHFTGPVLKYYTQLCSHVFLWLFKCLFCARNSNVLMLLKNVLKEEIVGLSDKC